MNFDKNTKLEVKIGGAKVPIADVFEFTVDVDLNQPDLCTVVLVNIKGSYSSRVKQGDPLVITGSGTTIFTGEILGVEPNFDYGQPSRVNIRALNALHKLTRGRKSTTFEKQSDKDIVTKVCQAYGLQADFGKNPPAAPKHDHVYQHNQTDLQFLRQRAARLDREILVEDKKLFFKERDPNNDSGIQLSFGDGTLER